jgi:hypothetical protein
MARPLFNIKAVRSSETSVNVYQTTWRHIPDDPTLHIIFTLNCCDPSFASALTAYKTKYILFDVTLRSFEETCCLHLQLFYPEDGGSRFLRKVGWYLTYQITRRHIPEGRDLLVNCREHHRSHKTQVNNIHKYASNKKYKLSPL